MLAYHSCVPVASGQNVSSLPAGSGGASGHVAESLPGTAEPQHNALSITCIVQNPVEEFRFLLCGIDTLDVGLFVEWGGDWLERVIHLQEEKDQAFGSIGAIDHTDSGRTFLHLPSGKPPRYRFHLQFPEYHAFIGMAESPIKGTPNVYVSFTAETLWQTGIELSIDLLKEDIASFGGVVTQIQPSRCDLAADFLIPNSLSFDFLMDHRVTRSRALNPHFTDRRLETGYFGDKDSPIRLRIYDKSLEVQKGGTKNWFVQLWGLEENRYVWRIEYQLRRTALRQYGLNTLDDLVCKVGGIWEDLTTKWFSLRLPDNDKSERRTVHPFWQQVQDCAEQLGKVVQAQRTFKGDMPASIEWLVSHISGCITSVAARLGNPNRHEVFAHLQKEIGRQCPDDKFLEEFTKRRIRLNKSVDIQGGFYEVLSF